MVEVQIVYWRDIPAQIRLRTDGKRHSRPLAQRFMVAIDEAAMRSGATGAQDYLEDWRTTDWEMREGEVQDVSEELVAQLEEQYSGTVLRQMIAQGGYDKAG